MTLENDVTKHSAGRLDLVSILRGIFAGPVIQSLTDLGLTARLMQSPLKLCDLTSTDDREAYLATFEYLCAIGLVERTDLEDEFCVTETGRYVFERAGAFGLMNSYRDYFSDYKVTLTSGHSRVEVKRLENVQSTGDLHGKKYFPGAIKQLALSSPECLIDLGCGNGSYLEMASSAIKPSNIVAVDISQEAVESAVNRLQKSHADVIVDGVVCSAHEVAKWTAFAPREGDSTVISAWFVVHEFCRGGPQSIVNFLNQIHIHCPKAELIIAEIIAIPSHLLSKVRSSSVYPEIQLFHRLSGQCLLEWQEHRQWIASVPYEVVSQDMHDAIIVSGESLPSTVVWHLVPRH